MAARTAEKGMAGGKDAPEDGFSGTAGAPPYYSRGAGVAAREPPVYH